MPAKRFLFICVLTIFLSSCAGGKISPAATFAPLPVPADSPTPLRTLTSLPVSASATPQPTETTQPVKPVAVAALPTPTAGPTATLGPESWQSVPVVPGGVSKRVQLIYEMGLIKGNNPRAYSKVGDCNMTLPGFMGDFDKPGSYALGASASLQDTVDYFAGSHHRESLAAKQGLTAHAVLSMLWVDWKKCTSYETPLTCEYRVQRPMYALISFGTNDASGDVDFEKAMRRVIDMTIGNGTIPILATKADNAEGDNSLNRVIVSLAYEYDLPVWNYWAAVQPLPLHGLLDEEHLEHLSASPRGFTDFTGDNLLKYGWSVRNLTALQVLDAVRRAVEAGGQQAGE